MTPGAKAPPRQMAIPRGEPPPEPVATNGTGPGATHGLAAPPGSRRARAVPAVLFVDDGPLVPFVQLAVALRRSGYRTIRVTTARRSSGPP